MRSVFIVLVLLVIPSCNSLGLQRSDSVATVVEATPPPPAVPHDDSAWSSVADFFLWPLNLLIYCK